MKLRNIVQWQFKRSAISASQTNMFSNVKSYSSSLKTFSYSLSQVSNCRGWHHSRFVQKRGRE